VSKGANEGRGGWVPRRAGYRSGFTFGSLSFVSTLIVGLASTVVTSRLYGVQVIGEYALVFAPVAALIVLSTVKEQQALIREITGLSPRDPRVTQLFAVVIAFSFGLTAVVGAIDAAASVLLLKGPLDAPRLIAPTLVSLAGYLLITNTGWNLDSILSAFMAGRQLFWIRLHEAGALIAFAVAVGVWWHSVWGMVIATLGSSLTSLCHRLLSIRPFIRPRLSGEEFRRGLEVLPGLLRFGLKATPGQIAQGASQQGAIWALGIVAPVVVVGAFSRAMVIPMRLQQASVRVTELLYPTLVGRHTNGDREGFHRAMIDSIRYEVIGLLLIASILGGAANAILSILGPGFDQAAPALALLALYPPLASITVTQTQALWAVDKPGRTSLIAILRLLLTLAMLISLTPRSEMLGPSLAILAGYALVICLSGIALRPTLTLTLRESWPRTQRLALIIAYLSGFVVAHASQKLPLGDAPVILIAAAAGSSAYIGAFLLCGGMNVRDRRRLAEARAWVSRRWLDRPTGEGQSGQLAQPPDLRTVEALEGSSVGLGEDG
jgi:O-antigen/teichoic acid export membrane protein